MNSSIPERTSWSIPICIEMFLLLLICLSVGVYILIILINKNFRENKMNWLSINVSLATAMFVLFQLLVLIFQQLNQTMVSCRFTLVIIFIYASGIMYAYCVESLHRLLAIRYFSKRLLRKNHELIATMIIGWIISVAIVIPYSIQDTFQCSSDETSIWLKIYSAITAIFLPSSIVCACNVSILLYIRQITKRIGVLNNNKNNANISRRRDAYVSKIMLLKFLLFTVGWLPIFFGQVFLPSDRPLPRIVSLFFEFLLYFSLLCNIFLSIYSNRPIRQYIKEKWFIFIKC